MGYFLCKINGIALEVPGRQDMISSLKAELTLPIVLPLIAVIIFIGFEIVRRDYFAIHQLCPVIII
jgi:hypothetical protein